MVDAATIQAARTFPDDGSADEQLRTLWRLLKPEQELPNLVGKHWQEVCGDLSLLSYAVFVLTRLPHRSLASSKTIRLSGNLAVTWSAYDAFQKCVASDGSASGRNAGVSGFAIRSISAEADFAPRLARLESLRFFSQTYGERAVAIVDEAVNGGAEWSVSNDTTRNACLGSQAILLALIGTRSLSQVYT